MYYIFWGVGGIFLFVSLWRIGDMISKLRLEFYRTYIRLDQINDTLKKWKKNE